jgi:hypothetical protein
MMLGTLQVFKGVFQLCTRDTRGSVEPSTWLRDRGEQREQKEQEVLFNKAF